jgi:hypothetical protein
MTDKTRKARPDFTVYGDTGLNRASGYLFEEYLAELRGERGRRVLREMLTDAVIGGIMFAVDMMIRRVDWRIDPASDDPEAQKWASRVDDARSDMELTWTDTIAEAASFIPWGWAVQEIEWKRCNGHTGNPLTHSGLDDGLIAWKRWGIRAQDTLLHWEMDPDGTPTAMIQLVPYTGGMHTIPLNKCLHFKTVQRKNSPEGISSIRSCYTSWYFKKRIQQLEAIGIERNWVGIWHGKVPSEWMSATASPTQAANYAQIKNIVTNIRNDEQSGIVTPIDRDEDGNLLVEIDLIRTDGSPTIDTDRVIQRHNHDIARALLAGFIFLGDGAGSYALSETQIGFFSRALGAWVKHMAEVITKGAIEPMMKYNGVPQEHWPKLNHGEIGEIDMTGLAENLLSLAQAGVIDVADPDLRSFVNTAFGLPVPKQSDAQEAEEDAAADPNGPVKELPAKEQMDVPTVGETEPAADAAPTVKSAKPRKPKVAAAGAPKVAMEDREIQDALAVFDRVAGKKYRGLLEAAVPA